MAYRRDIDLGAQLCGNILSGIAMGENDGWKDPHDGISVGEVDRADAAVGLINNLDAQRLAIHIEERHSTQLRHGAGGGNAVEIAVVRHITYKRHDCGFGKEEKGNDTIDEMEGMFAVGRQKDVASDNTDDAADDDERFKSDVAREENEPPAGYRNQQTDNTDEAGIGAEQKPIGTRGNFGMPICEDKANEIGAGNEGGEEITLFLFGETGKQDNLHGKPQKDEQIFTL